VIILLSLLFITGVIYKQNNNIENKVTKFDYSVADSIFNSKEYLDSATNLVQKKVASESELLDFSGYNLSDTFVSYDKKLIIDINVAGVEELQLLPGVGEKTAANIINYRKINGHFKVVSDILKVKGIGNKKYEKIKDYIKVE